MPSAGIRIAEVTIPLLAVSEGAAAPSETPAAPFRPTPWPGRTSAARAVPGRPVVRSPSSGRSVRTRRSDPAGHQGAEHFPIRTRVPSTRQTHGAATGQNAAHAAPSHPLSQPSPGSRPNP